MTDPTTGARALLRDPEGRVVRSRLDAVALSEIARMTGGVYVPAGTGALDLDSIYEAQHRRADAGPDRRRGSPGAQRGVPVARALLVAQPGRGTLLGRARPIAAAALIALLYAPGATLAQEPVAAPSAADATDVGQATGVEEASVEVPEPREPTAPELRARARPTTLALIAWRRRSSRRRSVSSSSHGALQRPTVRPAIAPPTVWAG